MPTLWGDGVGGRLAGELGDFGLLLGLFCMPLSEPSRKEMEDTLRVKSVGFITTVILMLLSPDFTIAV